MGALLGLLASRGKKTQAIRAVDVLFLGPFMVYVSQDPRLLTRNMRFVLSMAGAATVTYNAANFIAEQRAAR